MNATTAPARFRFRPDETGLLTFETYRARYTLIEDAWNWELVIEPLDDSRTRRLAVPGPEVGERLAHHFDAAEGPGVSLLELRRIAIAEWNANVPAGRLPYLVR